MQSLLEAFHLWCFFVETILIKTLCHHSGSSGHVGGAWRKGHSCEIKLSSSLREQTTVKVAWIAERLAMQRRGNVMHLLSGADSGVWWGGKVLRTGEQVQTTFEM